MTAEPFANTDVAAGAYRGRLAPSPTGYLHLGHARTFWTAQQRAQTHGGALVLRIEDLDAERCKPEYAEAICPDLHWFGLEWQEGPDAGGPFGPYRQSERMAFYLTAWRKLAAAGMVYPCSCSRKDVQRALQAPHMDEKEPIYPGICRPPQATPPAQCEPTGCNWRFRTTPGEIIPFNDGCMEPQRFTVGEDFGDFLIWRRDGMPAYQLAVVVDDAAMGITEVVRGEDLLPSTAQQLLLYQALGWEPPAFYHCPLANDANGVRLAKRTGAHSLRTLRDEGVDSATLRATETFSGTGKTSATV